MHNGYAIWWFNCMLFIMFQSYTRFRYSLPFKQNYILFYYNANNNIILLIIRQLHNISVL